jgi:hypothetical protein
METVPVILGVMRIILGFLLLVGIPGFAISLVVFPRLTDMSILDRLVYSAVLGIISAIAFVVFMDVVPGSELTLENLTLVAGVFSAGALMVWLCERWYLNRRLITHPEPQISDDSPDHQRYYSREINAAKDQFRQDTRTVVVYHESERLSGMNFVSHSYLLDVAEEIDIQQVVENKLKGTDSFILESPYPKTRYFELILLEHDEGRSSLVDDLQIYPVHVTTKPETNFPGTTLQRDTLLITERIYTKTSTEEVQWIYSHDFHIFAFIHAEDSLARMVDRILGILDEIVIAAQSGIRIHSLAGDRQILRSPFDAVSEKPRDTAVTSPEIPQRPEVQPVVQPRDKTRRPVILPGVQDKEISGEREGQIWITTPEIPQHPEVQPVVKPRDKTRRPVILPGVQDEEIYGEREGQIWITSTAMSKRPAIQTSVEPKEIPRSTEFQSGVLSQEIPQHPEFQPGEEQKNIQKIPDMQPQVLPVDRQKPPVRQTVVEPETIPTRPEGQPRVLSKNYLSPVENKLEVASIRKLQKNILRDLNMFDLTPDSFKRSPKIIDTIRIPKKADVTKKLSEAEEEMLDLTWLYE